MQFDVEVGLGPCHIVLDGDPAPLKKRHSQTVGWIKMPLCTKVGLGPRHIVLHGDPAHPPKRYTAPNVRPRFIVAKRSPISATAEHFFCVYFVL